MSKNNEKVIDFEVPQHLRSVSFDTQQSGMHIREYYHAITPSVSSWKYRKQFRFRSRKSMELMVGGVNHRHASPSKVCRQEAHSIHRLSHLTSKPVVRIEVPQFKIDVDHFLEFFLTRLARKLAISIASQSCVVRNSNLWST